MHFGERVFGQSLAMGEIFIKGAQCGKTETDGGAGGLGLHELKQIGAEMLGSLGFPGEKLLSLGLTKEAQGALVVGEGVGGGVFFGGEKFQKSILK